jgi:hypothetical protein
VAQYTFAKRVFSLREVRKSSSSYGGEPSGRKKTMSDMHLPLAVRLAAAVTLAAGSAPAAITLEDSANFQVKNTSPERRSACRRRWVA